MTKSSIYTILLCGIGGQGTITAADLLAHVAMSAGNECKISEIHGMAQRGGAVSTVVRFGQDVSTMVCDEGCADCIVSFEITEALRNISFLRNGGFLVVNDEAIKPQPVLLGDAEMPAQARERLKAFGATLIPASEIAQRMGSSRCANVVLLGALSTALPFDTYLWKKAIKEKVPQKTIFMNIEAFEQGADFAQG